MRVGHTAPLVAVAIIGAMSACASDGDDGVTSASSLAVETTATAAPVQADTVAPPATTEPEADEPSVTTAAAEAPATTTEGSIDVVGDLSDNPISGTGVFLEADVDEEGEIQFTTPSGGQPLTTGEERAAAFTIVCAE